MSYTPIKLTIMKAVYGGYGLGFADNMTWFVPYTIPGETVNVSPRLTKKKICFADVTEILIPSPFRNSAECPVFTRCGGCSYLHMDYPTELDIKKSIIKDCLTRLAKLSHFPEIDVISDKRFGYRDNCRVTVKKGIPGFNAQKSNTHIPLPAKKGCLLLDDKLNRFLLKNALNDGELKTVLSSDDTISTTEKSEVFHRNNEITFNHTVASFFQANRLLRDSMLDKALNYLNPDKNDRVLDAGCGCGFFSLSAAKRGAGHVHGFDVDTSSIKYAKINAKKNGISNCSFSKASFDDPIPMDITKAVVDPPRAGLSPKLTGRLLGSKIETIVYVSCNPSTWARDLKALSNNYELKEITMIDMFPATHHIEIISKLEKK